MPELYLVEQIKFEIKITTVKVCPTLAPFSRGQVNNTVELYIMYTP